MIGAFFFQVWGREILNLYHLMPAFYRLEAWFAEWGFWVIILKGLTPIPFKVVTITSGAILFSLPQFLLASLISRGARFFIESALFGKYGAPLHDYMRRHATKFTLLAVGTIVAGILLLWWIGSRT